MRFLPRPPPTSFTHRNIKIYLIINNLWIKKIGLFWLRDDFRLIKNDGLIEATKPRPGRSFYLYKEHTFKEQEAQKWWLSKSLLNFKKTLSDLNINLEIIETNSFKLFFDKLIKRNDFDIYWNKVYEPDFLKFDEYLSKNLKNKKINYKIFKGNTLNEIDEIKKNDGTPFKVFPLSENAGFLSKKSLLKIK